MVKIQNRKNSGLSKKRNQTMNTATPMRAKLMNGFNISQKDINKQCRESNVLDKKSGSSKVKRVR